MPCMFSALKVIIIIIIIIIGFRFLNHILFVFDVQITIALLFDKVTDVMSSSSATRVCKIVFLQVESRVTCTSQLRCLGRWCFCAIWICELVSLCWKCKRFALQNERCTFLSELLMFPAFTLWIPTTKHYVFFVVWGCCVLYLLRHCFYLN